MACSPSSSSARSANCGAAPASASTSTSVSACCSTIDSEAASRHSNSANDSGAVEGSSSRSANCRSCRARLAKNVLPRLRIGGAQNIRQGRYTRTTVDVAARLRREPRLQPAFDFAQHVGIGFLQIDQAPRHVDLQTARQMGQNLGRSVGRQMRHHHRHGLRMLALQKRHQLPRRRLVQEAKRRRRFTLTRRRRLPARARRKRWRQRRSPARCRPYPTRAPATLRERTPR